MEWIIAVCSAGLNLAAVWLVQKKTGLKPEKQTQWAAALLLAAAGGFASGYIIPEQSFLQLVRAMLPLVCWG